MLNHYEFVETANAGPTYIVPTFSRATIRDVILYSIIQPRAHWRLSYPSVTRLATGPTEHSC